MNKLRSYFILFITGVAAVMNSCQEDETQEAVSVKTLDAQIGKDGGVILRGSLTGFNKIPEHAIRLTSDPDFRYWEEFSIGRPTASGPFQKEITSGLQPGTYYYKACINYQGQWVFGEVKSFQYDKNKIPVIESISPLIAHIGDTITIVGKNFGRQSYQNTVYFNELYATPVEGDENKIRVVVPPPISQVSSTISVDVMGLKVSYGQQFRLHKPVITGLNPSTATIRGIIEIKGDHFAIPAGANFVKFGDIQALVVSSTRTSLKVIVPDNLTKATETITVFAQLQEAISPIQFELQAPEVSGISVEKGLTLSVVELSGNFFHPVPVQNKVYFGDALAEVIESSPTSLKVRVPNGPYPKRTCSVRVNILGAESVNPNVLFTIEDPWLVVTNTLPFAYYGSIGTFELNNEAFVIAPSKDYMDEHSYLWKLNPQDFTWTKLSIPIELRWSGVCVGNGTKAYLYTATPTNNFWEFDPSTNHWTQKTDFPGGRRDEPGSFAIGDDVYIGIGSDFEPYTSIAYNDFFKYDPASDSWTEIKKATGMSLYTGRTETSSFTLNGKGYIGCGARDSGMNDFWQYDPSNDSWNRMADIGPFSYTSSFVLNGKGYIANAGYNECWEYTDATNTWRQTDYIGNNSRFRGFAFTLNNIPYVGGGSAGWDGSHDYEMLQLDPGRMK